MIPSLQLETAPCELLLSAQQGDGPREHAGKVEQRVLVEQAFVTVDRDTEHLLQASREQPLHVRGEGFELGLDAGRERLERGVVPALRLGRWKPIRREPPRGLCARLAAVGQEVPLQPVLKLSNPPWLAGGERREIGELVAEPAELRRRDGTVGQQDARVR